MTILIGKLKVYNFASFKVCDSCLLFMNIWSYFHYSLLIACGSQELKYGYPIIYCRRTAATQSASADALDNVSPNALKTASPCMAVTSHSQAPTIGLLKYSSVMLRKIHFHSSQRDSMTNVSEDRKTKPITDSMSVLVSGEHTHKKT